MSRQKIKKEIIDLHGYCCNICEISNWNNNPITLELDHIDGNNKNNNISNLRLLCPNCHSQTNTFRGRNINGTKKITDEMILQALHETENIRQALLKVGLTPKGANYKRATKLLNIQTKTINMKNSQYNTCWINNGQMNKKIKLKDLNEFINLDWKKGRILEKQNLPSVKGKFWVTNGIVNKMVNSIPDGFWKGKVQS